MGLDKLKKWFFYDDEEDDMNMYDKEPNATSIFEKPKSSKTSDVVRTLNANKDSHLILFEPRAFDETQEISDYLKQKRATVVNLHRLQKEQAKRVIDFLSGVIYAIEGDIQQVGPKIYLCTPKNIGISGSIEVDDNEEY